MGGLVSPPPLAESQLRVDRAVIRRYAELTGDVNPIHLDPEFAARTPMGGIIAHGTLSLNLILQSLTESFGAAALQGTEIDIRFARPVRENDLVIAGGAPTETPGIYEVWACAISDAREEVVISGLVKFASAAGGQECSRNTTEITP